MIWLHGGTNSIGCSAEPWLDVLAVNIVCIEQHILSVSVMEWSAPV